MSERLLDYDPVSGMKTWFSSENEGDTWHLRYEQDTSDIVDHNKSMQSESLDRRADMWHAAKIPIVVMMEWKNKHGIEAWNPNHKDGVKRLLNDPDYRYLRVNHFIM